MMTLTLENRYNVTILIFLWITCTFIGSTYSRSILDEHSIAKQHEEWMVTHGRVYDDHQEKLNRRQIFKENLEFILKHNSDKNKSYTLKLNRFADLTNQEFNKLFKGHKPPTEFRLNQLNQNYNNFGYQNISLDDIPPTLDWRTKGAVTGVKSQGGCGSCWAFSTMATVESIIQIKTGKLFTLSEQQLVDCSVKNGCSGHFEREAYDYLTHVRGIIVEDDYPYKGKQGYCLDKNRVFTGPIKGYVNIIPRNEIEILKAVSQQPVVLPISSRGKEFQFYSKGIFNGPCGIIIDHSVAAIGYGQEGGVKYWLVKNSWGPNWGDDGYMKMQRDVGTLGLCGLVSNASYPIL